MLRSFSRIQWSLRVSNLSVFARRKEIESHSLRQVLLRPNQSRYSAPGGLHLRSVTRRSFLDGGFDEKLAPSLRRTSSLRISNKAVGFYIPVAVQRPIRRRMSALMLLMCSGFGWSQAKPNIVQPGVPGAATKTLPSANAVPPPVSAADVAFMQGMIMHHGQAVEMTALIPERTRNKDLLALGKRISLSQTDEMRFMQHWLEARGHSTEMPMHMSMDMSDHAHAMPLMPGMLTPEQMDALRRAKDGEFDRLFLTGMIQHHGGALQMVKDLFNTAGAGQDGELFDFATDVDNGQRAEIRLMERLLKEIH